MTPVVIQRTSVITGPACGHAESEEMALDACQYINDCRACGSVLNALSGDCCVFRSYCTVPGLPIQEAASAQDPS